MTDAVKKPSHYQIADGIEAIDIIEIVLEAYRDKLTPYEGHMLATFLKYRLRAGDKDDLEQDIGKSNEYREWLRKSRMRSPAGDRVQSPPVQFAVSKCAGNCADCLCGEI
jgi:uncharacterized protein (DUF2267 family)